ncbi:TraB/GumN family protein [Dyella sp. A6]|uniref:TraB/GumN family protein n=1 Tax=Dyella aluminiiresistens TaxID=3069105 RepID=UPI002E78D72E|nr:TraB/GumN family protein [Dyella sp. A6]
MKRRLFKRALPLLLSCIAPLAVNAAATTQVQKKLSTVDLAPVVVSGVLPGPALWKVSKGDHVMWVLGTVSTLPRNMQWETAAVERAVQGSQAVLGEPGVRIKAHLGFWNTVLLLPSALGFKKLPHGEKLKDVLPPDMYARWETQRSRYLRHAWGVERLRPFFAGKKLYKAAIDTMGLTSDGGVRGAVMGFARAAHVPVIKTAYTFVVKNPRADVKLYKQAELDDQSCLGSVLDATEDGLAQATARANAWATGSLDELRKTLSGRQDGACLSALTDTTFAAKIGATDIPAHMRESWLGAAEAALARNSQTFALLPMQEILASDGYIAALKQAGYTISAPSE